MLTNDNNAENKPKVVRRSSLKNRNQAPKLPLEALKAKPKRNSISWGQTDTFKFKENNPNCEIISLGIGDVSKPIIKPIMP